MQRRFVFTLWTALIIGVLIRTTLDVRLFIRSWWLEGRFVFMPPDPKSSSVFPVFYTAGERWMSGENLYAGKSDYLYSPLVAAFFSPLTVMPYWLANIVWRLAAAGAYLVAVRAWLRSGLSRISSEHHAAVFLILLPMSVGSINNAQSNPLMIALVMLAVLSARASRWWPAALCIAVVTYFKIYPLAAGLLLAVIFMRQFSWRLVAALLALGALSFVLQKPSYVAEQYQNWVGARSSDDRHCGAGAPPELATMRPRDLWTLLAACGIELNLRLYFYLQILGGAAIAALCFFGRMKKWGMDRLLTLAFTLVCCWMLLLGPATESATYILLAPAVSFATVEAFSRSFPIWMRAAVAVSAAILIGGMAFISWFGAKRDLWSMSVQQIGTVLFTVFALAWVFRDSFWRDAEARAEREA